MPRPANDVQACEVHATDADLDDLRARLAAARLPEAETVHPAASGPRRWEQGVPLADLVDVVNYWRTGYDWRSFEERLNGIGQFRQCSIISTGNVGSANHAGGEWSHQPDSIATARTDHATNVCSSLM